MKHTKDNSPSWGFFLRSKKSGGTELQLNLGGHEFQFKWECGWIKPKLCDFKDIMGKPVTEPVNRRYALHVFFRPTWDNTTFLFTWGPQLPMNCCTGLTKMGFEKFITLPWQDYTFVGANYHNLGMSDTGNTEHVYSIDVRDIETGKLIPTRFTVMTRRWARGYGRFAWLGRFFPELVKTTINLNHIPGVAMSKDTHERLIQSHDLDLSNGDLDPISTIVTWGKSLGLDINSGKVSPTTSAYFTKADWDALEE